MRSVKSIQFASERHSKTGLITKAMFARALVLALIFTAADAFLATLSRQSLCLGRQTQLRGSLAITCKGSDASQRLGRRNLMAVLPVSILVAAPGIVAAAGAPSFKADSPGVALDAIIVMKAICQALRRL